MHAGDQTTFFFCLSRRHYVRLVDQSRTLLPGVSSFVSHDSCDVHRWSEWRRHGLTLLFHLTAPTALCLLCFTLFIAVCALVLCAPVGRPQATRQSCQSCQSCQTGQTWREEKKSSPTLVFGTVGTLWGVPDAASVDFHYNTLHGIKQAIFKPISHFCSWCPTSFVTGHHQADIKPSDPSVSLHQVFNTTSVSSHQRLSLNYSSDLATS